jgi:hypothetical protein
MSFRPALLGQLWMKTILSTARRQVNAKGTQGSSGGGVIGSDATATEP